MYFIIEIYLRFRTRILILKACAVCFIDERKCFLLSIKIDINYLVEEKIKGQMVKKHILDLENFKHILTAFGDKLTEEDMDDIFGEFEYDDDGNIFTKVTMTKPQREWEGRIGYAIFDYSYFPSDGW